MKKKEDNQKKYAEDIATIKSLLLSIDEKPVIENWAFFFYSAFFLIGSILHGIIISTNEVTVLSMLYKVWIPVLLASIFFETVAWVRKMTKEELPVFSRFHVKFFLLAMGLSIVMVYVFYVMIKVNAISYLPVVTLFYFALYIFSYGMVAYTHLFYIGFFYIISGFILHLTEFDTHIQFIIVGIVMGISFAIAGILAIKKEKEINHE